MHFLPPDNRKIGRQQTPKLPECSASLLLQLGQRGAVQSMQDLQTVQCLECLLFCMQLHDEAEWQRCKVRAAQEAGQRGCLQSTETSMLLSLPAAPAPTRAALESCCCLQLTKAGQHAASLSSTTSSHESSTRILLLPPVYQRMPARCLLTTITPWHPQCKWKVLFALQHPLRLYCKLRSYFQDSLELSKALLYLHASTVLAIFTLKFKLSA
eukprot:1160335-Pelagomonas_calceolata.AAC.13